MALISDKTLITPEIGSRWHHRIRQTYYTVINHGILTLASAPRDDLEDCPVIIYESETDHSVWVRPTTEFLDGRFIRIALP